MAIEKINTVNLCYRWRSRWPRLFVLESLDIYREW